MKNLKKIVALFLAIFMVTSLATTAMAAESDSGIPENATAHTIELTVNPDGTIEGADDGSISPFIWNQENHTVSGNKTYTQQFNVPDRYFAYEMRATDANGNAISGQYRVDLLYALTFSTLASCTKPADGISYKVDHIDLGASNERVLFCITNISGVPIYVTLTYYSWA